MTGPGLVAPVGGPSATAGSGLVDSAAAIANAKSAPELVTDSALFAIDALGALKDPLNAMLSGGIGWLIEHISFLRDPLDWLAGHPAEIKAHAQTWQNVADRLGQEAERRESGLTSLTGWEGDAASAYRSAAVQQCVAIRAVANSAAELSKQVLGAGAMIGTVRSTMRGMIAGFVASVVEWVAGALATAAPTLGGSIGIIVAKVVAEACSLAQRLVAMVADLVKSLAASGRAVQGLSATLDGLAGRLGRTASEAESRIPLPSGHRFRTLDQQLATRVDSALDAATQSRNVATALTQEAAGADRTESRWRH